MTARTPGQIAEDQFATILKDATNGEKATIKAIAKATNLIVETITNLQISIYEIEENR